MRPSRWSLLVACSVAVGGCFVITQHDIDVHDAKVLNKDKGGDADTDTDADSDADTDTAGSGDGNDAPEDAEILAESLVSTTRKCLHGTIDRPGDADWFAFSGASSTDAVLVSTVAATDSPPTPTDTVLRNEDGATSNDALFGAGATDSLMTAAAGQPVSVTDHSPDAAGDELTYTVCGQLPSVTELEPNDRIGSATYVSGVANEPVLIGATWDGTDDYYLLGVRTDRVYRAALVPGHAIKSPKLSRLTGGTGDPPLQATDAPDYDDRQWTLGYPPDAGLMFNEPSGYAYLRVEGSPQAAGPYVLAIQELAVDDFPPEVEYNDGYPYDQQVPLLLQPDGSYAATLRGTLDPYSDLLDALYIHKQGANWDARFVDIAVQSASVGSDQDITLVVSDRVTEIATVTGDPGGWLGLDPVAIRQPLQGHTELGIQLQLASDVYWSTDPWFLTVRVHD